MEFLGNEVIWTLDKVAFLCSRKVPAAQVLKCYDWAIAKREAGTCVMLGAHSQLEKDVLHYLLKGPQPVVVVLARGMKKKVEPDLVTEMERGRLLLVSPFPETIARVTKDTAMKRNHFMLQHAQAVVTGHVAPTGQLADLLALLKHPYTTL